MKSRIAKGQSISKMSPAQKIMLATRLERFLPRIKKMAKRLVKVKRKEEMARTRNRDKVKTPGQKG